MLSQEVSAEHEYYYTFQAGIPKLFKSISESHPRPRETPYNISDVARAFCVHGRTESVADYSEKGRREKSKSRRGLEYR